jgi:hypothetical protein
MRRILLLIFWQFGLLASGGLFADVVTLKDGRQISGLVESGNIQELHIKVGDQSQTIDIHDVQAIQFGVSLPAPPPPKAAVLAPEPAPAGAEIAVRTTDSTGSRKASLNHEYAANAGTDLKNVPETPFTIRLTQPAFIDCKRGRQ